MKKAIRFKMNKITCCLISIYFLFGNHLFAQKSETTVSKGNLLYENSMSNLEEMDNWRLEGPAEIEFKDNWMHLYSPNEEGHHVYWCPEDFPSDFIAEWELQNMEPDAGLCIVFFSALGQNGLDIFDPSIKPRDGVFRKYTKSDINCYHISYYANGKDSPAREVAHLRKNAGFDKVQVGELGIPANSAEIHKITLVKSGNHIFMNVDDREIIDWLDDGKEYGPVLGEGKIGFRQMKWTHFRYRNFKVWSIGD